MAIGRISALAVALTLALTSTSLAQREFRGVQLIPCKLDSSSLDCKCGKLGSKVVVNCGFMTFPLFEVPTQTDVWPADRQAIVTEFYLFQGTLRSLGSPSPFIHMTSLRILNMRANQIRTIDANVFRSNAELRELNMENNSLTVLPPGLFSNNTKLEYLRLGSNKISTLPPRFFNRQFEMKILHLEDNLIETLPTNLFDINGTASLANLEKLYLGNNLINELSGRLVFGLVGLQELHIQVNPGLRYIEEDVFDPSAPVVTSLTSLKMEGSPSFCSKNATADTIDCQCAEGFDSSSSSGDHFCQPVDCGPIIPGLVDATASCTTGTTFGSSCVAQCNEGYSQEPNPSVYQCAANATWSGSIACTPVACPTTLRNESGHYSAECVGDTRFGRDPCVASCDPGYEPANGTSSRFLCNGDPQNPSSTSGVWTGNLTCQRKDCGTSVGDNLDGRAESQQNGVVDCPVADTRFNGSICTVRCDDGFRGNATGNVLDQSYICGYDGVWVPGTSLDAPAAPLKCAGVRCPSDYTQVPNTAVARCRGDISYGGDPCVLKCNPGYRRTSPAPESGCNGDACVDCRVDGTWASNSLSCIKHTCDQYMTRVAARFDELVNTTIDCGPGKEYGDLCDVKCITGYSPTGRIPNLAKFKCDANSQNTEGTWALTESDDDVITCRITDCGDILETVNDPYASVLNVRCEAPTRWDPTKGECTSDNKWSATTPARRVLKCGAVPPGLPYRDIFAQEITAECSPIGWAQKINGEDVALGANVCRNDCGSTLSNARPLNGAGSVSASDFATCSGDTGVGSTCTSKCLANAAITATFQCVSDPDGKTYWQETTPAGDLTADSCFSIESLKTEESSNAALDAVTIIIPLIAVIILIIVLLYYFEYLACLGLAVGKKRPGQKGKPTMVPAKKKSKQKTTVINPISADSSPPPQDSAMVGGFAVPMAL